MNNNIKHTLIEKYLKDLYMGLQLLPNSERDQQVSEIKEHLYYEVKVQLDTGVNLDQAAKNTLNQFLPASELSKKIIEEDESTNSLFNKGDVFFKYGLILTVGSFGGLCIPIYFGELNLGVFIPFIISLITGILLLRNQSIQWNEIQLKNIKWVSRILIGFSAVPLTLFAIRIIKFNEINLFSLVYLLIFLIAELLVFLLLQRLFKKHMVKFI